MPFCLQNWAKFMVHMFMILSRLGRIWSSPDVAAGLAHFGWLSGAVPRRRPCMRRAGSGCKIGRCGDAVSIIWVLVVP